MELVYHFCATTIDSDGFAALAVLFSQLNWAETQFLNPCNMLCHATVKWEGHVHVSVKTQTYLAHQKSAKIVTGSTAKMWQKMMMIKIMPGSPSTKLTTTMSLMNMLMRGRNRLDKEKGCWRAFNLLDCCSSSGWRTWPINQLASARDVAKVFF